MQRRISSCIIARALVSAAEQRTMFPVASILLSYMVTDKDIKDIPDETVVLFLVTHGAFQNFTTGCKHSALGL